ncbi:energy transducer TonB [Pseudoalteromonas sp. NGC95]|uniref:energy transducer TonB n=1 Tax=Pseudoalteromonas sp. NGC95 TaxID=2792051 RepID=UPI0018CD994C|nr:energy transducer TonB [Pseudoalteromonas sp. NGC95]MBH0016197.1 energy transducer TonB [Pseudoalteromonas sp. NGC95]
MKYIITTLTSLFLLTACSTTPLPDNPHSTLIMPNPPVYPIKSVREKIEGSVTMSFDVNTSGKPINIKVIKAEPVKIFDKAAIRSLSKWRYAPKVVNGIAVVDENLEMTIDFNLAK